MDELRDDSEVIRPTEVEVLGAAEEPLPRRLHISAPATAVLVALNVLVYLVYNLPHQGGPPIQWTYWPAQGQVFPQIMTYMFVHANVEHILFNMVVVFSFGWIVEQVYGSWKFLLIYLVSGVLAALAQSLIAPDVLLLGASGAASAILAVFVRHFPRAPVQFFFVIPMPAWLAIAVIVAINIFGGLTGGIAGSVILERNIGYIPHLAGMVVGLLLSLILIPPGTKIPIELRRRR